MPSTDKRTRHRRRALLVVAALAAELAPLLRRGYGIGGDVVVRCRDGHLFTTFWIPAVSAKALRLGPWRLQRCPVGRHWTLVTPVDRRQLSEGDLAQAQATHDARVP